MPFLKLDGSARLHYGERGSGPTVIMVHGSPGEGRAWANVVKHLPEGLRVLTPDLPGYGGSDPLPAGYLVRTEAMAAAIGELVGRCESPVWLCGHSYGGNVALHTAVRHRERVAGAVLLEPVFLRALELTNDLETFRTAKAFFVSYLVRAEFAEDDAIGGMIDFWCGDGTFARLPAQVRGALNSAVSGNAEDVRASFAETISAALLASFDRPVTIGHGDSGPRIVGEIAGSLAKLLPRARTTPIHGAAHLMLNTHPESVARLIQTSLYAQRADGPGGKERLGTNH